MNRVELIARIAGKGLPAAIYKPTGMNATAHPDQAATSVRRAYVPPVSVRPFSTAGQFFGATISAKQRPWVAKPDLKEGACFKEGQRHGAHWLTRVAEKMKRGWH